MEDDVDWDYMYREYLPGVRDLVSSDIDKSPSEPLPELTAALLCHASSYLSILTPR
jgi:hypothetical protein